MENVEEKIDALAHYRDALIQEDRLVFDNLMECAKEIYATVVERQKRTGIMNV